MYVRKGELLFFECDGIAIRFVLNDGLNEQELEKANCLLYVPQTKRIFFYMGGYSNQRIYYRIYKNGEKCE